MRYLTVAFLLSFLFSCSVLAQELISSDFYFYLKAKDYNHMLSQKQKGQYDEYIPHIRIDEPYATVVENIHVKMDYQYKVEPEKNEFAKYSFHAQLQNLSMNVEKVVTDDVIMPQLGNIHINIGINGECRNLLIEHVGEPVSMDGQLEVVNVAGKLFIKVNNLVVDFDHNWSMQVNDCHGPHGYDQTLKQAILEFLKDKNFIGNYLGQQLQGKLNAVATELTESVLQPHVIQVGEQAELRLEPGEVFLEKQTGLLKVKGLVLSQFEEADQPNHVPFVIEDEAKVKDSGFVLSPKFLKVLSTQFYQNKVYKYSFASKDIDGFNRLMSSRFYQFFLFPDLMNFDRKSNFQFDGFLNANPDVSIIGGQLGYLWFAIQGSARVDMLAPTERGYVPYIHFQSDIRAKGWISIHREQLYIGLYRPTMNLNHQWNKDYVTLNRPSQRFSKNYFLGKIIEAFTEMRFNYELPQFDVHSFGKLAPHSLEQNHEWVQLVYKPK